MQLSEIITHFKNVKPNGDNSYMACCPYHGDEHQSLSISEKDGKILLNCFAGCDYHNVLWAAGLQGKDLFNDAASQNNPIIPKPPSVEYLYTSDLKKVRFYLKNNNGSWRKSFCWKHHDDQGNWQKGMGGVRPPLYRQEVLETARQKRLFRKAMTATCLTKRRSTPYLLPRVKKMLIPSWANSD